MECKLVHVLLICSWTGRLYFALLGADSSTFRIWQTTAGARVCPAWAGPAAASAGRCCRDTVTSTWIPRKLFTPQHVDPGTATAVLPSAKILGFRHSESLFLQHNIRMGRSLASSKTQPYILHLISNSKMRRWKLPLFLALSRPTGQIIGYPMLGVMNPISTYVCNSIFIMLLQKKNTRKQGRNYIFGSSAHQDDSLQGKSWSVLLPFLALSSQHLQFVKILRIFYIFSVTLL